MVRLRQPRCLEAIFQIFNFLTEKTDQLGSNLCISTADENKLTLNAFTIIKILHYRGSERGSFFFIVWTVERFYVSNLKMKIPFLHGFHQRRLEVRLRIAVAQCIIWWYYWFSAVGSVCRSYAIIYEFLFHLPFHFKGWERFDFVLHDFLSPERTFECYPCHSLY